MPPLFRLSLFECTFRSNSKASSVFLDEYKGSLCGYVRVYTIRKAYSRAYSIKAKEFQTASENITVFCVRIDTSLKLSALICCLREYNFSMIYEAGTGSLFRFRINSEATNHIAPYMGGVSPMQNCVRRQYKKSHIFIEALSGFKPTILVL